MTPSSHLLPTTTSTTSTSSSSSSHHPPTPQKPHLPTIKSLLLCLLICIIFFLIVQYVIYRYLLSYYDAEGVRNRGGLVIIGGDGDAGDSAHDPVEVSIRSSSSTSSSSSSSSGSDTTTPTTKQLVGKVLKHADEGSLDHKSTQQEMPIGRTGSSSSSSSSPSSSSPPNHKPTMTQSHPTATTSPNTHPSPWSSVTSTNVHVFHYAWYEVPPINSQYMHWNHRQLPHWNQATNNQYPDIGKKYDPTQGEIGSVFWPQLGLYSSEDRQVIRKQLEWMQRSGIGVLVLSWWGRDGTDGEGRATPPSLIRLYFQEAPRYRIKITFHLEPYENRHEDDVRMDIQFLVDQFGHEEALYRVDSKMLKYSSHQQQQVPVFYVYDSYHIPASNWARLLNPSTPNTIRNTKYDAVMLSLYLSPSQSDKLVLNGFFDGVYTYFASRSFTYASNPSNWKALSQFCNQNGLIFSPSIGPGYNDVRVRPWNTQNIQSRDGGNYYRRYFDAVMGLDKKPQFLSLTSFNEWHEGTNLEPSISYRSEKGYEYEQYPNDDAEFYLKMTGEFVDQFEKG